MATVGTRLLCNTTTLVTASSTIVGQGPHPELWLLYSTTDATDVPVWTTVDPYMVRAFDITRGRENELADIETGTASVTVENQNRTFDPEFNAAIRPMNRWWLRSQFSGVTESMFLGYAESYVQSWPDGSGTGGDALVTVALADEMKVLALDHLPVTDPPRDTYQDVCLFDGAAGYYPMLGPNLGQPVQGRQLEFGGGGYTYTLGAGPIVGQADPGYGSTFGTVFMQNDVEDNGEPWDAGTLTEFAFEGWYSTAVSLPASQEILLAGPWTTDATWSYRLLLNTTGTLTLDAKNSAGTNHSINSTTAFVLGSWYHVVGTITGGNLRLYVNGVQENSVAWTGSFELVDPTQPPMFIGNGGTNIGAAFRHFDELAFYRVGLTASRVLAHYTAGTARGFPRLQEPGDRVYAVLDSISSTAPRYVRTGTRDMIGTYMTGQDPLSELRKAETAENIDAVLFIAKDGTITFLDDGYRLVSPWNTVQYIFDDDGTDIPYGDVVMDYSEAFLFNVINATRTGGTTVSDPDTASIAAFKRRPMSLSDLPLVNDSDVSYIASALKNRYKDPMSRVTALRLSTLQTDMADAALGLELADVINVQRTPPGGGAKVTQTLNVWKISISGTNASPVWSITLGVSPL